MSKHSTAGSSARDHRLALAAMFALARANVRYWPSAAGDVREQLAGWRTLAAGIEDPLLGGIALEKLARESFNAEAAAMIAMCAPRRQRRAAVIAVTAIEVLYDYLDGVTETPVYGAAQVGERLFGALLDAVELSRALPERYLPAHEPGAELYIAALVRTARQAIGELPAATLLADELRAAARRGAEAQLQLHRRAGARDDGPERWARRHRPSDALEWREYLAGAACSVLCVHALVAAAADPASTRAQARMLDRAYQSIAVLPTVLDALIDRDASSPAGGILSHYPDPGVLPARLADVTADAWRQARELRGGPHHAMILASVVAYYASAPGAQEEPAAAVFLALRDQLGSFLAPPLAVLRTWRAIKRVRAPEERVGVEAIAGAT